MLKRILFFNLFIVCGLTAQQNYHFRVFPESEKLSNLSINDLFQDSYGFMWIVTDDGLNRYDGKSVKIYKNQPGDETSLPDNATYNIIEDKQKNLWVACFNVVGKLNRKTDKFKRYSLSNLPFKRPPRFYASLLAKDGSIWFASSQLGVIRFNTEKDKFENIELSKNNKNANWGEVHSLIQLKNDVIIAADFNNGLKKYNRETNKFDSYNLKPGFSPKKISVILEGKAGNLWIGGDNRLIKYLPAQYTYSVYKMSQFSKIKSNYHQILALAEDDENNLLVSQQTHGLIKLSKNLDTFEQYVFKKSSSAAGVIENAITNIHKDKYGIIWLSFLSGGLQQVDLNANSFEFIPLNIRDESFNNQTTLTKIEGSPKNKFELIIGTDTEGLISFDTKTNKYNSLSISNGVMNRDSNITINALKVDNLGNIWFAMNKGYLNKLDYISRKISTYKPSYYNYTAVPVTINSLNINSKGNIWISSNLGIDVFTPKTEKFVPIPRLMNKEVNKTLKSLVTKIAETRKPLSSILNVGEGANLDSSFTIEKKQKVLLICVGEGRKITEIMYDYGSLLKDGSKTIWSFDKFNNSFYSGGGFKNRISFKCVELEKGNYNLHFQSDVGHSYGNFNTIATPDSNWWGIQAFTLSDEEFSEIKNLNEREINKPGYLPFEIGRVVEFSKKYSNTVWIGSNTNSFFRYNLLNGDYKQYNYHPKNISDASHYINTIYEDLDGILWVGTYASLVRLNPDTDDINIFTTLDGIPGGLVNSIVEDNFGTLWIGSSGGVSKLNKNAPLDKYVFVNYDSKDGLQGLANNYSVWKDENSKIYYGGKGGIISFLPGKINSVKPNIVIYDLKIDDVSIFENSTGFGIKGGIYDATNLDLSYNQNDLAFEFASIHFSRPSKNKISYQLKGFNDKWYDSDRNYASFTNLDPGEYTFKVKGSNGDGIWNETGRSIDIVINPPWWQTTGAYIGYGLLFVGLIFGIDRFQRRRLLSKAKEKMQIQEAEYRAESAELQAKAAEAQAKVIQAENERKTKELEEARELQLSMLPKDLPNIPNLDIAVYMQTATEVGGDYYDFHVGLDGTLTVVIGDATGHGMKAGTMVTTTKSMFNILAPKQDILATFSEMSKVIKGMNFNQLSMCLMLLKIKGNELSLASAAMPPALIYRNKNNEVEEILMKGMPLGTMNNFPYTLKESHLEQGDTILLMSDGLPELVNESSEMYGYDKIKTEFNSIGEKEPEEIVNHLKNSASSWVNGKDPDDDVTFVVLKMK